MGTLANSEDPFEMQHVAAFHQGLQCLLKQPRSSEKYNILGDFNLRPLNIYNGPS